MPPTHFINFANLSRGLWPPVEMGRPVTRFILLFWGMVSNSTSAIDALLPGVMLERGRSFHEHSAPLWKVKTVMPSPLGKCRHHESCEKMIE
jgi:hypothetical protein